MNLIARAETQKIETVDFRKPRRPQSGVWKVLTDWQRELCVRLGESWSGIAGGGLKVTARSVETMQCRLAMNQLPDPGFGWEMRAGRRGFSLVMAMPRRLAIAMTGAMLGNVGETWPEDRGLSAGELSLCEMLAEEFLRAASETWPADENLKLESVGRVERPARAKTFPLTSSLIVGELSVEMKQGVEKLFVLIPTSEMEAEAGALAQVSPAGSARVNPQIEVHAKEIPVDLVVELGSTEIPVSQLSALQPGDVVILNRTTDDRLPGSVGGVPKFLGRPGRIGQQQGYCVEEVASADASR